MIRQSVLPFDWREAHEVDARDVRSEYPVCPDCGGAVSVEFKAGLFSNYWVVTCAEGDWRDELDAE